jgi:hypothetical protein
MQRVSSKNAPPSSSTDSRAIIAEVKAAQSAKTSPEQAKLAINTCRFNRQVAQIINKLYRQLELDIEIKSATGH